jgi:hypothetical protein
VPIRPFVTPACQPKLVNWHIVKLLQIVLGNNSLPKESLDAAQSLTHFLNALSGSERTSRPIIIPIPVQRNNLRTVINPLEPDGR